MDAPEVYRIRLGGGRLAWIGAPLVVLGLLMVIGAAVGPQDRPPTADGPGAGVAVFGGLLALTGALLALGRAGVTIDRRGGRVARWWGLLVPFRSLSRPLAEFDQVSIATERRSRGEAVYQVWPVALAGGGTPFTLAASRTYRRARLVGERVARFLQLPLHDAGSDEVVVRTPAQLDESVRDQARRLGAAPPRPELPPGSPLAARSQVEPNRAVVELPAPGPRSVPWPGVIGVAVITMVLAALLARPMFLEGWRLLTAGGVAVLGGALLMLIGATLVVAPPLWFVAPGLARALTAWRLEVSRGQLVAVRRGPLRTRGWQVEAGQIEQIAVAPPERLRGRDGGRRESVVSVRTDEGFLEFGAACTDVERAWLRDLLLHYLAG